jgi:chromosome segregation ATPase
MQALETKCDDLQSEVCQLEANLVGAFQQSRSLQNEATEARADAERAQTVAQQFALEKASLEGTAQRLQDSLRQVASEAECRIIQHMIIDSTHAPTFIHALHHVEAIV